MNELVLSIFPGIDLLGRAFEEQGFCVVRGPDVLWGGDVRSFHPPVGVFDGVIGGPPCQCFSRLRYIQPLAGAKHGNLIPEFERVVSEAHPRWFLMENVPEAPLSIVKDYEVHSLLLNNRWLGEEQNRTRRFSFGTQDGRRLVVDVAIFEAPLREQAKVKRSFRPPTVLAGHGAAPHQRDSGLLFTLEQAAVLQGLPRDFLADAPFTVHGKRQVIGNGVPLPMGRAIAKAVKKAMGYEPLTPPPSALAI